MGADIRRLIIVSITCLCFTTTLVVPASAGVYDDIKSAAGTTAQYLKIKAQQTIEKYQSNQIDGSFADIYPKPFFRTTSGKFVLIGGSAVLVGAIAYFTAGTGLASAGPIATWVGTHVGMATGVGSGATAAGLAVLGGGTIASGGLGIAGGLAVIAAISDVGLMIALDQAADSFPPDLSSSTEKYRLLKIPVPKKASDRVLTHFEMAEELLEEMEEMTSIQPEYAQKATEIRNHYNSALTHLQNIDPNSDDAGYDYIARAVLEYNFMEYEKALLSISEAMKYTKNKSFCGYMLSLIRLTRGDDQALKFAAKLLDQVSKDDPSAIQPVILQTIVHMDSNEPTTALNKALNGLDQVGDNFELNWRAAEIAFFNVNKYQISAELYEEALSNVTQNEMEAHCKMMIALSYERLNKRKKALKWYQKAIAEIDDKPDQVTKMSQLWNNFKQDQR